MTIVTVNTPFNIDLEFKVASFFKRVAAWVVDMLIITAYFFVMAQYVLPLVKMHRGVETVTGYLTVIIPVIIYQFTFEIFFNGQTLGKKVVGIRIIDKEGNEPTWGQFVIRWLLGLGNFFVYVLPMVLLSAPYFIPFFLIIYLPDTIVLLASRKLQRIGDLAAGTVVIDVNYKTSIYETIYQHIEVSDYVPLFPQVMRLTDRDINGIRNLLDARTSGRETEQYTLTVVDKIKSVLSIETELDGRDFLQQLLLDYNYLAGK